MGASPSSGRRWYHPARLIRLLMLTCAIFAVFLYVFVCVLLYSVQQSLIYPGMTTKFTPAQAARQAAGMGVAPWSPGGNADPEGFVLPDFHDPAPRGTVVVLHGNGEYAWYHADTARALQKRGFRAFLYEYPGYGGRSGSPSEPTIVPDLQAVIRALDKAGLGPVYIWGQSLGGGVAAAACADQSLPVHGLLLITPWDTLPNVGASFYPFIPVHLLMKDQYDSVTNLAHFTHPIFLARSDHDEVVPPRLTLNLYAHLPEPKKEIVFLNSGHNTWPGSTPESWLDEALDFIAPK
jgi:alpha-beta hydrolase superfamily lysophospholipase